jgi:hypothetical protein
LKGNIHTDNYYQSIKLGVSNLVVETALRNERNRPVFTP